VRRRNLIAGAAGFAAAWPLTALAQTDGFRRIGVLMGYAATDPAAQAQIAALRQGLQKLGWEEGRNIRVDVRFPGGDVSAVRTSLMELMRLTPDVLVTNTNLVTAAVQAEVGTIPIVFIFVGDPVGSGFVSDDARPNGNLTGFANSPALVRYFKSAEVLASALKVKLVALSVHDAAEIERALTRFAAEGNGGLIVGPHAVTLTNRDLIVTMAARLRLPAIYPVAFYAQAGGLISYGLDPVNQFQQGAGYVDRILRGTKPADLPVQYPTKLQLVVNLKTAKALGLAIPESFLQRADEVIE